MSIRSIDLIFLEVNSLEESLEFYVERLGFKQVAFTPDAEPPMATLKSGELRIMFAEVPVTMVRRGRGVHFFLTVDDVDEFYQSLRATGTDVAAPADDGWGGRFITVEDPDKYRLFFVTWQSAERDPANVIDGARWN